MQTVLLDSTVAQDVPIPRPLIAAHDRRCGALVKTGPRAYASTVKTLVGAPEGPDGIPSEVPLFMRPQRGSEDSESYIVWMGSLALGDQVDLTADSFTELVQSARRCLDETYPNDAVAMRVFILPDGPVDDIRRDQIAEIRVWLPGEYAGPGRLR